MTRCSTEFVLQKIFGQTRENCCTNHYRTRALISVETPLPWCELIFFFSSGRGGFLPPRWQQQQRPRQYDQRRPIRFHLCGQKVCRPIDQQDAEFCSCVVYIQKRCDWKNYSYRQLLVILGDCFRQKHRKLPVSSQCPFPSNSTNAKEVSSHQPERNESHHVQTIHLTSAEGQHKDSAQDTHKKPGDQEKSQFSCFVWIMAMSNHKVQILINAHLNIGMQFNVSTQREQHRREVQCNFFRVRKISSQCSTEIQQQHRISEQQRSYKKSKYRLSSVTILQENLKFIALMSGCVRVEKTKTFFARTCFISLWYVRSNLENSLVGEAATSTPGFAVGKDTSRKTARMVFVTHTHTIYTVK